MAAVLRRHHVLASLIITLAVSIGVGFVLATPYMIIFPAEAFGVVLVLVTAGCGLLLTFAVAEVCRPLQRAVLEQAHRRND